MHNLQLTHEELDLLKTSLKKFHILVQLSAEEFERQVDRQTCATSMSSTYIQARREDSRRHQQELSALLSKLNAATT